MKYHKEILRLLLLIWWTLKSVQKYCPPQPKCLQLAEMKRQLKVGLRRFSMMLESVRRSYWCYGRKGRDVDAQLMKERKSLLLGPRVLHMIFLCSVSCRKVVRPRAPCGSLCILLLNVGVKCSTEDEPYGSIKTSHHSFISSGVAAAATKTLCWDWGILVILPWGLATTK